MAKLLVETFVILFLLLILRHSKFFKAHMVLNFLQRTVMIILLILFCSDLKCTPPFNNVPSIQTQQITMKPSPFCSNNFMHTFNPLFNQNMYSWIIFSSVSNAKLFPSFKLHDRKQNSLKLINLSFLNSTAIEKFNTPQKNHKLVYCCI